MTASTSESDSHVHSSIGGIAVALVAAVLTVVSVFLPKLESPTIPHIEDNTLIQGVGGLLLLGCAAGLVWVAYRAYRGRAFMWLMCGLGVAILAISIYEGTGSRLTVAPPGIAGEAPIQGSQAGGLFLAGFIGVLLIAAGLILGGHIVSSFDEAQSGEPRRPPAASRWISKLRNPADPARVSWRPSNRRDQVDD
jgi:hypothetical protein